MLSVVSIGQGQQFDFQGQGQNRGLDQGQVFKSLVAKTVKATRINAYYKINSHIALLFSYMLDI